MCEYNEKNDFDLQADILDFFNNLMKLSKNILMKRIGF